MADNNNPIRYSDLVVPDNSISDLIKQLAELSDTYARTQKTIKEEALQVTASLERVSGATESGRQATRKASDDAERLAKAQANLAFAQTETARKIEELKLAQREQNELNKLSAKLNNAAEGSYKRLAAQYALNKRRLNAMSDEQRRLAEEQEGLVTSTRKLYEEMKRLQEETGMHQLNVGNYTEASDAIIAYADNIKNTLGLNNAFGESLLALGRGGEDSKNALMALGDGAKALGNTLLGLLANPVFAAIAGVASAGVAFKWWYDYNAGLIEATRLTQQFTSKQGDDLKAFRNQVQAIADVYNQDFREVLIATNALAQQFGIEFNSALTIIQDGFVAGADLNGEFLDSLKEYPAYFREAGISADQFVAIIAQTTKAGIFSDKGIDAIKEANIRLREMTTATAAALDGIGISSQQVMEDLANGTKTTFDVMQMVSQKLNELPETSAVVGTAIADIFGGPGEDAGLRYLQTLKDISLSLDEVKTKSGELSAIQEQQLQSQVELENALSGLFDATGGFFEGMNASIKNFVNEGMTTMIHGIVQAINYFTDFYNRSFLFKTLWNGIVAGFKTGFDFIGNLFNAFGDVVQGVGLALKGAFTLDFRTITQGLDQMSSAIPNLIKTQIKDTADNFVEGYKAMAEKIEPITIPVLIVDENGTTGTQNIAKQITKAYDDVAKATDKANKQASEKAKLHWKDMSDVAKEGIGRIEEIQIEGMELTKSRKKAGDIYDVFGLDLDDEQKEGINTSVSYAMQALNDYMDAYVAASERKVERADREVESAENALQAELQARAAGYANNVALAQKELAQAKKTQDAALRQQQEAQRAQEAIQTTQQAVNMVSASALVWSQLGFPFAIPAIAVMWASFAASKIKAAQMAKESYGEGTVELLTGGSHQSGNDVDLGTKADGTRRRAEGGEFFAVINKRNSRKFRKYIPGVINALNDGSFAEKYLNAYQGGDVIVSASNDLRGIEDDVRAIKEQGSRRTYNEGRYVITEYKNLTRRVRA